MTEEQLQQAEALLEKKIAVAEAVQGKIDTLALPFCEATVAAGRCGEA